MQDLARKGWGEARVGERVEGGEEGEAVEMPGAGGEERVGGWEVRRGGEGFGGEGAAGEGGTGGEVLQEVVD